MNRIALLIGSLGLLAAGTASAQTSISVSIGFGEPRPYFEGSVFVGRPHLRPVYRPYFYRSPHRYHSHRPYIVVPAPRRLHRSRGLILVEPRRFRRDDDRRFRKDFDRERGRYRRDRFDRD